MMIIEISEQGYAYRQVTPELPVPNKCVVCERGFRQTNCFPISPLPAASAASQGC